MKKLFYYFLIATLAFNFVGCSDKDKDLDDVIDELDNGNGYEDEDGTYGKDYEVIEIDYCTYKIYYKTQTATLMYGYLINGITEKYTVEKANVTVDIPKYRVKGDFVIPQTITYKSKNYTVTKVNEMAFSQSYDLTSVTFPDEIEYIGINCCPSFTTVDESKIFKFIIGKGIKFFGGHNMFYNNMIYIIKATTPPDIIEITDNNAYKTILMTFEPKLYVPKESIKAYQEHEYWKYCTIGSIEDELEE